MILQLNDSKKLFIKARDYYSTDFIEVKQGETYLFQTIAEDRWVDLLIGTNAAGFNNILVAKMKRRLPTANVFALCGTIDRNEEQHFLIGINDSPISMPQSGQLHFFANDHSYRFWYLNNWGKITVTVTRIS